MSACLIAIAIGLIIPSTQGAQSAPWALRLEPATTPALPQSVGPQLTVSSRGALLSWIERAGANATLKFSESTDAGWTPPRVVATGSDWFINWADVPSVVRLETGTLVAHWLQKSGPGTYAYDVRLSHSKDDGRTWAPSFLPHHDGTRTEHGFASLFDVQGGGLGLVWLDGRAMTAAGGHEAEGDMSLRFASFDKTWRQTADLPIDTRVCECCPTAVAMTSEGPLVAYRDRGPTEVRDILVTRLEKGKWTDPKPVHADAWQVPACPVNGPSLSARGRDVAIAWFNAKDGPKSFVAFSSDAGRTFSRPIRLDDEATLGRVDVLLLPDGSAAASYIEFAGGRASFRVRRVDRTGMRSSPVTIAGLAGNRTSGIPRVALHRDQLIFAWVEGERDRAQVHTTRARLP